MQDMWIAPNRSVRSETAGEAFGKLTTIPNTEVAYAILYSLDGVPIGATIPGRWPAREVRTNGAGDEVAVIERLDPEDMTGYREVVAGLHHLSIDSVHCWAPAG